MTVQQNPAQYAQAIQAQLESIVSPVPVYANFNRNFASQPLWVVWTLRNVHQPVYTGPNQTVKGIDRPVFQINVLGQDMMDTFNLSNTILQSLHGYAGLFGGDTYGFQISKADVNWLYNLYDDTIKLHHIIMDCTIDVPC